MKNTITNKKTDNQNKEDLLRAKNCNILRSKP